MFKFTLTIATSAFLFMSGTADLFAMELLDDGDGKPGNQLVIARTEDTKPDPINHMPKDLMGVIFIETSKLKNPRHLTSVCKHWYSIMREDNIPQGAELHYSATNLLHTAMNPFMQRCMETYWENLFYNGILRYTPLDNNGKVIEGRAAVTLKFSGLKKTSRTFDLSACGDRGRLLLITESMDRFLQVTHGPLSKTTILVALRHLVEQEIKSQGHPQDHPFASLMKEWDADKAPVGMFWRGGNNDNLAQVDNLTTASMNVLSSKNLYGNAQLLAGPYVNRSTHKLRDYLKEFHVSF